MDFQHSPVSQVIRDDDVWVLRWVQAGSFAVGHGYRADGTRAQTLKRLRFEALADMDTCKLMFPEDDPKKLAKLGIIEIRNEFLPAFIRADHNATKQWFSRIVFSSEGKLCSFKKYCTFPLFETERDFDAVTKLCAQDKIPRVGWADPTRASIAHQVISVLGFDIETFSPTPNAWPDKNLSTDIVFMVAIHVIDPKRSPSKASECIVVIDPERIPEVEISTAEKLNPIIGTESTVFAVTSERELLKLFFNRVRHWDPDVITGHNINNYDIDYMAVRMARLELPLPNLSQTVRNATELFKHQGHLKDWEIALTTWDTPDRIMIDTMHFAKLELGGLESYKLKFLAEKFLGQETRKANMEYVEMFSKYRQHNWQDIQEIIHYCVMDTIVSVELFKKLQMFETAFQKSLLTCTDIQNLYILGPSSMISKCLYSFVKKTGDTVLNVKRGLPGEKYPGAIVDHPVPRVYSNVIGMDFAALYPSVIIANNICLSTLVPPDLVIDSDKVHCIQVEDIVMVGKTVERVVPREVRFLKKSVRRGLLSDMLEIMLNERMRVRSRISTTECPIQRDILDKQQLALKIVANSIYGCLGNTHFLLYSRDVAQSVTGAGRYSIICAQKIAARTVFRGQPTHHVYTDTDSIYCTNAAVQCDDVAREFAKCIFNAVSQELGPNLRFEFENLYSRCVFMSKKRYAARKPNGTIMYKGVTPTARKRCPFAKHIYKTLAELCLDSTKSAQDVSKVLLDFILQMRSNQVAIGDLVIPNRMTREEEKYARPEIQPLVIFKKILANMGREITTSSMLDQVYAKRRGVDYLWNEGDPPNAGYRMLLIEDYDPAVFEIDVSYYLEKELFGDALRLLQASDKLEKFKWVAFGSAFMKVSVLPEISTLSEQGLRYVKDEPVKQVKLSLEGKMAFLDLRYVPKPKKAPKLKRKSTNAQTLLTFSHLV